MGKLKIEAFTFAVIILLATFGIAADKSAGERGFKAELSGNEEVPPVETEAKGEATFQFRQAADQLTYVLSISQIKDITGAFICKGKKGENGAIVIDLFREPRKEDISGTFLAEGKIEPYLLFGPLQGRICPILDTAHGDWRGLHQYSDYEASGWRNSGAD